MLKKKKISDYLFQKTNNEKQASEELIATGNDIRSVIHTYVPDKDKSNLIPLNEQKVKSKEGTCSNTAEEEVAKIIAKQLHIAYIDLNNFEIDQQAVLLVPNEDIRHYNLLPIGFEGGRLMAAMSGKTSIAAINYFYSKSGYYIVPVITTESALAAAIDLYTNVGAGKDSADGVEALSDTPSKLQTVADIIISGAGVAEDKIIGMEGIKEDTGEEPYNQTPADPKPITEVDIAKNVAKQLHINYVDLDGYDINPQALALISSEHIHRYKLLPIDFDGDRLIVAMSDPTNIFTIDDLRVMTGHDIIPVVVAESDLRTAIDRYNTSDIAVEEALGNINSNTEQKYSQLQVDEKSGDAPTVKLVNLIVTEAFREGASDIFIEPQEKEVRVRYRVDGVLQEVMRSPKHVQSGVISRIKIMAGLDIAERRLPQDGRFGLAIDKKPVDFRVATLPTIYGEQVVLRILEKSSIMLDLDDLGFLPDPLRRFKESFSKPYGAILITGPTGSGKTTTLYSVLNILNHTERNLITVEDPVEYRLPGINQVQVNTKAGLTFASALRSILRHDPDIIMIGEIRDEETATIAIESALTGHLVLSTLHTNTAPATLTRLIEMGIEPFLVSSAVDCIVAQRLARKLCTKCKELYKPTKEELIEAGFKIDGLEPAELYRARGCRFCGNTGYQGRVGLYEVMNVSENIERMLVGKFTVDDLAKIAVSEGMQTLREDGLAKVKAGITSIEEIARVTT